MLRFWKKKQPQDPEEAIRRGDHEAALGAFRRAAEREPEQAARWQRKIAETLALANRVPEAVTAYLEAARLHERNESPLQAIALYKAALRLSPGHPEATARLEEYAPTPEERRVAEEEDADASAMTLRTRLRKYAPLFSEFDREALNAVVEVTRTARADTGTEIFRQGEPGDSLFVVADGEVALTVEGADGDPVEIDRIGAGSCFGEVSALRRVPRNVTAIATRPTELLEIGRDYLEAVAIAHPQVWKVLEDFQQRRLVPVGV
jgi:tetratricopeptide (TPR) repeat protein